MINIKIINSIRGLLTKKEQYLGFCLISLMGLSAICEAIGIGLIMPFMGALVNPSIFREGGYLNSVYIFLSPENENSFILIFGVIVFIFYMLSILIKAVTSYKLFDFCQKCEYGLSSRVLNNYLSQPYEWILLKNTSELGKNILSDVNVIVFQYIQPSFNAFSQLLVAICISALLVIVDPMAALISVSVLGLSYIIVYFFIRQYLLRVGKISNSENNKRYLQVNEIFSSFKQVKIGNHEQDLLNIFDDSAGKYANALAKSLSIGLLPRYILEAIVFGGILLSALMLTRFQENSSNALPVLGLYGLAGFRLLPALQQIYSNITQVRFASPTFDIIYKVLVNPKSEINFNKVFLSSSTCEIKFEEKIELRDIGFKFKGSNKEILNKINLSINKNSMVGFVGSTGSGKTTLVDIIIGLLSPTSGCIFIDGKKINNNNMRSWQDKIGYVSQGIFLNDSTIADNIAFGVSRDRIDMDLIIESAKTSMIHDFILNLPDGYNTRVGDRGSRLSGGQKQRIGIARALYRRPSLLVFDEATSALDNITERELMDSIERLSHQVTIIMVAHRLSSLKSCDTIFTIDNGVVSDMGSYNEMLNRHKLFNTLRT